MKEIYLVFAFNDYEGIGGINDLRYKTTDYEMAVIKAKGLKRNFDNVQIYEALQKGLVYEKGKEKETIQDLENKIKNLKEND